MKKLTLLTMLCLPVFAGGYENVFCAAHSEYDECRGDHGKGGGPGTSPVPEPATMALEAVGLGALTLAARRLKKR